MARAISEILQTALFNFEDDKEREGFGVPVRPGPYSPARLSGNYCDQKKEIKRYTTLSHKLLHAENDAEIVAILENYFEHEAGGRKDPHAFSAYLLDELIKEKYADVPWDRFIPKEQQFEFYKGPLFRGEARRPDEIFKIGMKPPEASSRHADNAGYITGKTGISFSKNLDAASRYGRFVYLVDYQGEKGIDCMETGIRQGDKKKWLKKAEVNVMRPVWKESIVGCLEYSKEGKLVMAHHNPSYRGEMSMDAVVRLTGRMDVASSPDSTKPAFRSAQAEKVLKRMSESGKIDYDPSLAPPEVSEQRSSSARSGRT